MRCGSWLSSCALAFGLACGPGQSQGGESDTEVIEHGHPPSTHLYYHGDIDILIVVDNSASMGAAQGKLAAALDELVDGLEDPRVDANYRIAVTSTDNGLADWCDPSTVDAGRLLLSSCLNRAEEFEQDGSDAFAEACSAHCVLDDEQLAIQPTATHLSEGELAPRPWLERIDGVQNLPEGVSMVDALRCIVPQGIDGCAFESQLESQYLALERAETPGDEGHGFRRPLARLAILHVTDEADCSANPDWPMIFAEGGNQVFWSNLELDHPTSGVCWNAGVECEANIFDDSVGCVPENKDQLGHPVEDLELAVMRPLSRYIDPLADADAALKELDVEMGVLAWLIGGVDEQGAVQYAYEDGGVPGFVAEFGIGPGCVGGEGQDRGAVPPARLATFVDRFDGGASSICAESLDDGVAGFAEAIKDQFPPMCLTQCAADLAPQETGLQPACEVWTYDHDPSPPEELPMPECAKDDSGIYLWEDGDYVQPDDEVDECYILRTDVSGVTPFPHDDLSPDCHDHANVEIDIARRVGFSGPAYMSFHARCEMSTDPQGDCGY